MLCSLALCNLGRFVEGTALSLQHASASTCPGRREREKMREGEVCEKKGERPAGPSDLLVLARQGEVVEEALELLVVHLDAVCLSPVRSSSSGPRAGPARASDESARRTSG